MTDTDRDIEAIRTALEAGPTPEPWVVSGMVRAAVVIGDDVLRLGVGEVAKANAAYIAAASPERIARLLAALEAAQRQIALNEHASQACAEAIRALP